MDIPSEDPRFFSFAQRLVARPNSGEMGREMFEDIRQFSFADRTHGWLETESGNLKGTDIHLWRVRSSGHTIELNEDGKATILIPLSGRIDVETRRGEFGASNGKALLFGPNWRRTHVNALDNEYYDALVFFLDPERNGRLREMSAASAMTPGLSNYLKYLLAELEQPNSLLHGQSAQMLAGALLDAHIRDWTRRAGLIDEDDVDKSAGSRQTRRAEEIMLERFGEPLAITDIADKVGVSERALQLAFRRHRNASPHEWLSRIRLDAVRRRLLASRPAESVSSIALECGFAHFGRFAAAYRKRFGEFPSSTLAKTRTRHLSSAGSHI